MRKVYLVYLIDEEEDSLIVDCVFKEKENAEDYARHHNDMNKKYNNKTKLIIKEMSLKDVHEKQTELRIDR